MPESTGVNLEELGKLIKSAKRIARQYHRLTGKPLGITGEVGEYEAARHLGLRLAPARQEGYDATRGRGRSLAKIEIKTRRVLPSSKPGQRVPRIRFDHEWDGVVLVLLDEDFEPIEMLEADRESVASALQKPGSKARNERGALAVSKFRSIATSVWKRDG